MIALERRRLLMLREEIGERGILIFFNFVLPLQIDFRIEFIIDGLVPNKIFISGTNLSLLMFALKLSGPAMTTRAHFQNFALFETSLHNLGLFTTF